VSYRRSVGERPHARVRARPRRTYWASGGPRPDRVAAWAVALGIFLIFVASATSRGATGGSGLPTGSPTQESGGSAAAGGQPAATDARLQAAVARRPVQLATWYGPGLYGRRTACGLKLRATTLGVAHRSLPCGTRVTLYRGGRLLTVPVVDRGPWARGVSWDLTAATARRLRLGASGSVRALYQAPGSRQVAPPAS
jgi:rare lipoprotein A (peptidoglycan hydrolase)